MTDRRMTVTLRPKSMGELAGWNLILSTYLEQGFTGGGDFQIRMDYKESDGLTMKLIKGKEKLRETHVKREPLDVAVRVMRNTSGFTLAFRRRHESPGILLEQGTEAAKDTIAVEEAAQSHSKVETLLSQMRMRALLNAQFSLMEELKGARTADHKELGAAYQKLEDAFQSALIAECEIQRGKVKSEKASSMDTEKMEGPEPIKLIVHAECEMREVKELMKIMTEIQKEYSCNCTLDVKKYVVFH